jgi:signal transduction histidine kinase/predicted RNA-binding protein with RPS1 domain/DNA-binding response OmpR family regulator
LKSKQVMVTVSVERVFSFGVFVRLPDGTEGYIRQRELAWEKNIDPRQQVAVGDTFEAQVLPPDDQGSRGRRIELSRRAALESPWQKFFRLYRQGDVVQGRVSDVASFGVFVEILPGVDGLVPLKDLSALGVKKPDDLLWVGDVVEAVITHLGRQDKAGQVKVGLSIRDRIRQLERAATKAFLDQSPGDGVSIAEHLGVSAADIVRQMEGERKAGEESRIAIPQRVGHIMVVDADAAIRQPLVEWFHRQGYQAVGAGSAAAALEYLSQQTYGLLLIEVGLPSGEGVALIRRVHQMRSARQDPIVAVMGGVQDIEKQIAELERHPIAEVLMKPLDLFEVERLLNRIERGEPMDQPIGWPLDRAELEDVISEGFGRYVGLEHDSERKGMPLPQQLGTLLSHLVRTTEAEMGLLLRQDPISRAVSIVAQSGEADVSLNREALYSLKDSPLKDVIHEGRWVLEGVASKKAGRFRKLLDLLSFESCVGVPVGERGDYCHALFLFHRTPRVFSRYRVRDAWATAAQMAAAIERDKVTQHLHDQQKLLLLGQLTAGFGHEVSNKVSGVELELKNLQMGYQAHIMEATGLHSTDASRFQDLQRVLDNTLHTVTELKQTVGLFQQLTRSRSETVLNVNQVVERAARQLQPVARRNNVEIWTELAPELPRLVGDAIQLQQVILNLMLNAIQQMALQSKVGGTLEMTSFLTHGGVQPRITIRVKDQGPGIHKRLWEEIFSLGYSTRPGGSGLGLFVARSLTESLGGRLVVEQSVISIGTTFVVELPVATMERGNKE